MARAGRPAEEMIEESRGTGEPIARQASADYTPQSAVCLFVCLFVHGIPEVRDLLICVRSQSHQGRWRAIKMRAGSATDADLRAISVMADALTKHQDPCDPSSLPLPPGAAKTQSRLMHRSALFSKWHM